MMKTAERTISIGDLSLPLSFVTSGTTILGQPETGKTNLCRVIAESVMDAGVPVCIIDPKGDYWGLRLTADGLTPAHPIAIFGGDHGDLALTEDSGKVIADALVDTRRPMILDLSHFESDAARGRFVTAFCKRLYYRKQEATFPLLVIIDEVDLFAPQNPMGDQKTTLHAVVQLRKLGRKRGIGVCGNAQRAARIHKDLVEMSDLLVFTQLAGKNDTKTLSDILKYQMETPMLNQMLRDVSRLPKGLALFYSPSKFRETLAAEDRPVVVPVPLASTFDSSRTPEVGDAEAVTNLTGLDIDALRCAIAEAGGKVDTENVEELKAEIERLRKGKTITVIDERQVPVLTEDDARMLIGLENLLRRIRDLLEAKVVRVGETMASLDRLREELKPNGMAYVTKRVEPEDDEPEATPVSAATPTAANPGAVERLRAVLHKVYPRKITREALAFFAGYKPSGGAFRGALKALRDSGAITDDSMYVGLANQPESFEGATNAELVNYAKGKLTPAQVRIFDLLWNAPNGMPTWDLATASGYNAAGGAFRGALKALRDAGLIAKRGDLYEIVADIR